MSPQTRGGLALLLILCIFIYIAWLVFGRRNRH
jgi:hypothetical protein